MRKVFDTMNSLFGTFITVVCIAAMFFLALTAVVSALWFMR